MQEQALVDAIDRALAKAPPMTPHVLERIIALLSGSRTDAALVGRPPISAPAGERLSW